MAQYIDKSALVAEIEKRKKEAESNCGGYKSYDEHRCDACTVGFYEEFLEIIDTLEVKDVDLEKEFDDYTKDIIACDVQFEPFTHLYNCAKHFFELGIKSKGE